MGFNLTFIVVIGHWSSSKQNGNKLCIHNVLKIYYLRSEIALFKKKKKKEKEKQ